MSLADGKLACVRQRNGRIIARCPACAEIGEDNHADNLRIWPSGAYKCIKYPKGSLHNKRILKLAGAKPTKARPMIKTRPPTMVKSSPPVLPLLRHLSVAEMAQIQKLRGWSYFVGLQLLTNRGLLWYGDVFDGDRLWPSWIITDRTRRNAQARRLDGQKWEWIEAKAKTLKRCDPSWPIGAAEIDDRPYVILCEGGPDFLAALFIAWFEGIDHRFIAPVCMTGANNHIHPDALSFFAKKHIRIATHDDHAGIAAGERWCKQLYDAGAEDGTVDRFIFHGMTRRDLNPVNDLADYATLLNLELPLEELFFSNFTVAHPI